VLHSLRCGAVQVRGPPSSSVSFSPSFHPLWLLLRHSSLFFFSPFVKYCVKGISCKLSVYKQTNKQVERLKPPTPQKKEGGGRGW
jgi:hypothetical protein